MREHKTKIDLSLALLSSSLRWEARLTALVLAHYADENGRIRVGGGPSVSQLGLDCGFPQRSRVVSYLSQLKDAGWLQTVPQRNGPITVGLG
jgi:hypothetical protein